MTKMQVRRGVIARFVLTAAVALLASGAPIITTSAGATTTTTGRSSASSRPATDHPVLFSRTHRVLSVASPRTRPERTVVRRASDSSTAAVAWKLLAVLLSVGLAAASSRRRSGAERRNLASRGPPVWATTT